MRLLLLCRIQLKGKPFCRYLQPVIVFLSSFVFDLAPQNKNGAWYGFLGLGQILKGGIQSVKIIYNSIPLHIPNPCKSRKDNTCHEKLLIDRRALELGIYSIASNQFNSLCVVLAQLGQKTRSKTSKQLLLKDY